MSAKTGRPRFGINTFLFRSPFTTAALTLLDDFARMGFEGVEAAIETPGELDLTAFKRRLSDTGLQCCSLCGVYGPGRDLRGDKRDQDAGRSYITACIDACVEVGCDLLVGPHYSRVGRASMRTEAERRDDWAAVVSNLREVCAHAERRGVVLAVETLNRFESDFLNTVAQALRLIEDVGSPALQLHLDTFHMNIEEQSLPDAVRAAGTHLAAFHASENDRGAPGSGHIDWSGIFDALKEIGYGRWIVIESFTPDVEALAKAASIWRTIADSPESLARDGLSFLRREAERVYNQRGGTR